MNPFEGCCWVGGDDQCESPIISRTFIISQVNRATLWVTGLGFFEARINGIPVTDHWFLPVVSDYGPRDFTKFLYPLKDVTTHRIYYYRFDVTPFVVQGENTLTIQLGNGWYRQKERIAEGPVDFGDVLKAIYRLELETNKGTTHICSDAEAEWMDSDIRYSNLFYGEVVDPLAVSGKKKPVLIQPAPQAQLSPAMGTPDKRIRTISPRCLRMTEGRAIYDAGENISGLVCVTTAAPAGERITLRFAEMLNPDGELDYLSTGAPTIGASGKPQIMEDVFVADGTHRSYMPKFVWHAFRYFEIEGSFLDVSVEVIHSDTPITSTFQSSSEGMNFLYDAFLRTQLSNMHGSFPSDCPHRERLGYTGDGQICAKAAMLMLDSKEFYAKWIQDILDCQDVLSGHVQHTAPFMGGGGGPGGWGSAIITVPYAYYLQYGCRNMLEKCYPAMKRWISYLLTRMENGLIVREEEGGWCLGDWCTLTKTQIPEPYVNSCYFAKALSILEQIAMLTGNADDAKKYADLRQETLEAIRQAYFSLESGSFCDGVQGADAYAIWCGLAGEELAKKLAEKYEKLGIFDTGFLGTDILLEVLLDYGYADTAFKLLESEEKGSFLYMKRQGATTLWENFRGAGSHSHPMFGGCSRHLFTGFLGIRQRLGTAGYEDVIIKPCMPSALKRLCGSILTPKGRLTVVLEMTNDGVQVSADGPPAMALEICI